MDFLAEEMIDLKPAVVPGKKQITMEQKIAKIARFYLEKKKQQEQGERLEEEEAMAQLVFYFTRDKVRIVVEKEEDYAFCFANRRKSQVEILLYHDQQELQDFLKYMRVPVGKKWTKEQMAEHLVEQMHRHPEYLSILFSRAILEELLTSAQVFTTDEVKLSNETAMKLCSWGLLDMEVKRKKGRTRAYFAFAGDVQQYVDYYKEKNLTKVYREKEQVIQPVFALIQSYGIIDMDTLYEKYSKLTADPVSKESMRRYIYLHGTFNSLVITGEDASGKVQFAICKGVTIEKALARQAESGVFTTYGTFTKKQIQGWKHGVTGYSAAFLKLQERMQACMPQQENKMAAALNQLYGRVIQGDSLEELQQEWSLIWEEQIENAAELCQQELEEIYESTPIIPLLAHSRRQMV